MKLVQSIIIELIGNAYSYTYVHAMPINSITMYILSWLVAYIVTEL